MLVLLLAVAAAAFNALASVLQRQGAAEPAGSWLLVRLVRRPVWLAGIGALIVGFILQATALTEGDLIVVQPILVTELPFSLVMAALVAGLRPGARDWAASAEMSVGLSLVLVASAPSGGDHDTSLLRWLVAIGATAGLVGGALALAHRWPGSLGAAVLGGTCGAGFGLSASLLDTAASQGERGAVALFGTWQLYAMVVVGVTSVYLLQRAFAAGPFIAAQPPATVLDPLTSVAYGLLLFDEQMRGGIFLLPELAGAALVAHGAVLLSRSPLLGRAPRLPVDGPSGLDGDQGGSR